MDATPLGASLDFSNANIQGHTIIEGLNAKETSALIAQVMATSQAGTANYIDNKFKAVGSFFESNNFKVAVVAISLFIGYLVFRKRR